MDENLIGRTVPSISVVANYIRNVGWFQEEGRPVRSARFDLHNGNTAFLQWAQILQFVSTETRIAQPCRG